MLDDNYYSEFYHAQGLRVNMYLGRDLKWCHIVFIKLLHARELL